MEITKRTWPASHKIDINHKLDFLRTLFLQLLSYKHALVDDQNIDGTRLVNRFGNGVVISNVGRERGDLDAGC